MHKFIKISQIITLTVFILFVLAGCEARDILDKAEMKGEEASDKFMELQEESQKDIINFSDRQDNGLDKKIEEKSEETAGAVKEKLIKLGELLKESYNEWGPEMKSRIRESVKRVDSLIGEVKDGSEETEETTE